MAPAPSRTLFVITELVPASSLGKWKNKELILLSVSMQTKQLEHPPGREKQEFPAMEVFQSVPEGWRRELRLKLSAGSGWCHSAPLAVQLLPHFHSHFQFKISRIPVPGREVPPSGAALTQHHNLSLWECHLNWRILRRGSGLTAWAERNLGSLTLPVLSHLQGLSPLLPFLLS